MMNGMLVQEEAEHLAARVHNEVGEDRALQIQRAFEIALGRRAENSEVRKFSAFEGPLASICLVLLNSNEFLYVE